MRRGLKLWSECEAAPVTQCDPGTYQKRNDIVRLRVRLAEPVPKLLARAVD